MRSVCRIFLILSLPFFVACGGDDPKGPGKGGTAGGTVELPEPTQFVVMETSMGKIKIGLFEKEAPVTVKNFLNYVDKEHYNLTIFHRVIPNFMIQGGGLDDKMKEWPTDDPIKNESGNGLPNLRGTVAMARTGEPHSATAQFFINVKDNPDLDKATNPDGWGYCVFGKVVEGMDVVEKIRNVETHTYVKKIPIKQGGKTTYQQIPLHKDVPVEPVYIESIRRADAAANKGDGASADKDS